ncbi:MAG: long-chain fatty acid--CoA ligase [Deltaproteobacteria bacterium]|nr:long-chain fatty acid--CoA ligase [Candidatus Zymogenaceae bacterium]
MNIGQWVYKRAFAFPNRPFLREAEREDKRYNNAAFNERVNRTAHMLAGRGVSSGDRVGTIMLNSSEFLEVLFACAKLGAILVPMNFRLAMPELSYMIDDASPRVMIYSADFSEKIDEIREGGKHCDAWLVHGQNGGDRDTSLADAVSNQDASEPTPSVEVTETDPILIIYTSGTTGDPKGVMITHRNLTFMAIHNLLGYGVDSTFVSLVTAPLFHIGALAAAAIPVIYAGGSLVLKRFFNASEIIKLIDSEKINYMFAVPVMYQMMSDAAEWEGADFSHVRYFIAGGAPMPVPFIRKYQEEKGVSFAQGYGLTETGRVSSLPLTDSIRKAGSVGVEEFHVFVRIVDENDQDVPPGGSGEILVRGPNVFPGYWNKPAETKAAFVGEWFRTGDMGRRDEEGFLYILGRKVEMIISSGENIYPAEVERVIQSIPQVKEAAAVGMPDEKRGEVVAAFVMLKAGEKLTEDELIDSIQDRIAYFKIPKKVIFVDDFPRNSSGKILRRELKESFQ